MSDFNFKLCEQHLKKRVQLLPYSWSRKQNNEFDYKTKDIYKIRSYGQLIKRFENESVEIKNYAYNRWFNFWSAYAIESFFVNNPYITISPEKNQYHQNIDFYINNIPFDHKTSKLPNCFIKRINEINQPNFKKEVIEWLYKNQSKQRRFHLKNRLFVITVNSRKLADSWKVKSELTIIREKIHQFLYNVSKSNYKYISLEINNQTILSDIIFVIV